ncbi:hypothetical protein HK101_008550 [Irineochytrium annulatum]|nr:hypothetical protein HK101_008550 [Irineochytrium annulatum]
MRTLLRVVINLEALKDSKSLLPYDFYYDRFHFCTPNGTLQNQRESLGSILFGDRLFNSPFEVLVDGLPAAQSIKQDGQIVYRIGFPLGHYDERNANATPFFYNHYEIVIEYHKKSDRVGSNPTTSYRIVGVLVTPHSVSEANRNAQCAYATDVPSLVLSQEADTAVNYTYTVQWTESKQAWGTRWDKYLHVSDPQIHWFSIVNSIVIVLMLTGMIAMILLRALHKDISRYNSFVEEDGGQEDFGWKLVHADVFRPPPQRMLLSVLIGNGAQLFAMCGVTLAFAVLGFLSPSSRGALSTMTLLFYVSFAGVAGYGSARIYKMLQGEFWRQNVFLTATLVPAVVFIIFLTLNFILVGYQSSAAVPFGTMLALIALWFLISAPLCVIGAYFGFKHPTIENPVKTNQIPRQVPSQPLYLNTWISALIGGILPFGAIFIELYFIMNSIWFHRIYYVFGFLMLVFMILIVTCAEVSILLCYFHLCSEIDNFPSTVLYFGWSFAFSMLFVVLTGSVGYISSLLFVRKIFSSIKVD